RHQAQRGAHPYFQRGACRSERRQGHARRYQGAEERRKIARRAQIGRRDPQSLTERIMADTARLKKYYEETIRPELMKRFGYKNVMQVPRLEKIVLNMGVGEAVNDNKKVQQAADELSLIAGQRAIITKARMAIATFKIRARLPIGCKV